MHRCLAFCVLLSSTTWCSAQVQYGGTAPSRGGLAAQLHEAPVVFLDPLVANELINEDNARLADGVPGPFRFAATYAVDIGLEDGVWSFLPTGDRVWRVSVECRNAKSLGLVFDRYVLPSGGKLYLTGPSGEQRGAFIHAPNGRTSMAFDQFAGERITIEYVQPTGVELPELHIGTVYPAYLEVATGNRDFGESMPCHINVICPEGDAWRDQARAVALVNTGAGNCSGVLLNNCLNDGTPYLLTANHCLVGDVQNWTFTFNWDSPVCTPTENAPQWMSVSGAELLVTQVSTDFALLRLSECPPESYGVYYSGWNASGVPATEIVGIHHPNGDIKKISRSLDEVEAGIQVVGVEPREVWKIEHWDDGIVEPGSSGSGAWDQNKLLVGQLSGGLGTCDDDTAVAAYGRFDLAYPLMQPWLGACDTILEGIDATDVVIPILVDAAVTSITNVPALLCGLDSIAPMITLKNNGLRLLTSAVIEYSINGGALYSQPWSGTLLSGQTALVALGAVPVETASNTLTVTVTAPNGVLDEVPGNDPWSITYTASFPAAVINLILTLDDFGSDITWDLLAEDESLLYTGGPYGDGDNGEVDSVAFCLTNDCYTFIIRDAFGDGICCEDGNGHYVIRDANGVVHGESNGQYAEEDISEFCLDAVGMRSVEDPSFGIHPNPNAGHFVVHSYVGSPIHTIRLLDAVGRVIADIPGGQRETVPMDVTAPSGSYFVQVQGPDATNVLRMIIVD